MKKSLVTLISVGVIALCMGVGSVAAENNSSFSFKKLANKLCGEAEKGQLFKFKSELRKSKSHIRSIYPQVKCNGQSLMQIAQQNQSDAIVEYLKLKAKPEVTETGGYLASRN